MPSPKRDLYKARGGKMLDSDDSVFDLTAWIKSVGVSILTAFKLKNVAGTLINPAKRELQQEMIDKMPTLESNGGVPVNLQDQHSTIVNNYLTMTIGAVTLGVNTNLDDTVITLEAGHGTQVGEILNIKEGTAFLQTGVLAVNVNEITLDMPLDFAFTTSAICERATPDMDVDGSSSIKVFKISPSGLTAGTEWDITKMKLTMVCTGEPTAPKFGDLTALTNGIVLRKVDGTYKNLFNAKTNANIQEGTHDAKYLSKPNFSFEASLFFAGQGNYGVTVRLCADGDDELQVLVRDDIQGLVSLRVLAFGHVVTN